MSASRFLALYAAVPAIEALGDLRALNVAVAAANPGDKGQHVRSLSSELIEQAKGRKVTVEKTPLVPGLTPGVSVLEDGDSIRAELQRKRAEYFQKAA